MFVCIICSMLDLGVDGEYFSHKLTSISFHDLPILYPNYHLYLHPPYPSSPLASSRPLLFGLIFPSAFSGNHLTLTVPSTAIITKTSHTKYPFKIWVLAPAANKLVKSAGPTVRIPETSVRARAFRVPSVVGEGEMSFRVSWTAAVGDVNKQVPERRFVEGKGRNKTH
jgi:hypothetical protein